MKPAYIPIYNVKTTSLKVLLTIAVILGIFGLAGIVDYLFLNKSWQISDQLFLSIFLILQSASSVFIINQGFRNTKYFVAWNENEINFLLPKSKQMETIPLNEIKSVQFEKHIVKITLKNNEVKHFNLNYLFLPKKRQVAEYFEILKSRTELKSH
ncbi:MAG TPA: hypothetical protein VJ919_10600 [Tangfeifania sp.]|nr:hypothetical protein [Tangfeifania sp.]